MPSIKAPLTARQRAVYDRIVWSIETRGIAPTVQELMTWLSMAMGTVHGHLVQLEERGWILREYHRARAIRLVA